VTTISASPDRLQPDASAAGPSRRVFWTFVVASVAAFMSSLDNLVVTMALPAIRSDLHTSLDSLEWTVNAYTLVFAVLLLPAATLGDRYGRRRVFVIGLAIFTVASAAAALAPNIGVLVAARAVQGAGGAVILPLSLTILSAAVPRDRRGAALGVWGAVSGLAVALGPVIGGAVTEGASWQWIFWINVPIGLALLPLAQRGLRETHGPSARLDVRGLSLVALGLLALVYGVIRGNAAGWSSPVILACLLGGAALLAAFAGWESRAPMPMLPPRLFTSRAFSATNIAALLFSFGMFGAIFLLAQYLQIAQGYGPLSAGLRTLPWTAMPLVVAPIAGPLSDRIGGRPLLVSGLALQAGGLFWLAQLVRPQVPYDDLVAPFVLCGIGMALFFVPVANVVMGSVPAAEEGVASGTNNAIRELGGVFGIAVLGAVFSAQGSYVSPDAFTDGLRPAVTIGAAVVLLGAFAAATIPRRRTAVGAVPTAAVP
jgi:EmrB/QacA subfamily drug resistance transporter